MNLFWFEERYNTTFVIHATTKQTKMVGTYAPTAIKELLSRKNADLDLYENKF